MKLSLIKLILMISAFLGITAGFLSAVPYIGGWIFFILMCFTSVIELGFLIKVGILRLDTVQESIVIGGLIGFLSFIAFSIVYMPLVLILRSVFNYYTNFGVVLALQNSSLPLIIVISVFMAVLSGAINAFTGFVTYYVSEFIRNSGE